MDSLTMTTFLFAGRECWAPEKGDWLKCVNPASPYNGQWCKVVRSRWEPTGRKTFAIRAPGSRRDVTMPGFDVSCWEPDDSGDSPV